VMLGGAECASASPLLDVTYTGYVDSITDPLNIYGQVNTGFAGSTVSALMNPLILFTIFMEDIE